MDDAVDRKQGKYLSDVDIRKLLELVEEPMPQRQIATLVNEVRPKKQSNKSTY